MIGPGFFANCRQVFRPHADITNGFVMTARQNSAPPAGSDPIWVNTELTDEDYHFICQLVYERSRIHLGKDKKVLVTARLNKRLRFHRLTNYHDYCQLLRSPAGLDELTTLIDSISTNHTHFFREMKHFDFLRDKFLPEWQARPTGRQEPLRVWSAASSTGEEPYTIAIHLAENLAPADSGAWAIEATDISTRVLEIARLGVYEMDRLNGVTPELLRRYFQRGVGDWEGHFRVKENLRQRVNFHHLNLLEANYPFAKPFQLIFCRNVMIYFDRGYLLVGHSESLSGVKHNLRLVQPAIYRKP
jgi:chemotaxis protein methyltransferase CheR